MQHFCFYIFCFLKIGIIIPRHRHLREIDCSSPIVGMPAAAWATALNLRANQYTGPKFSTKACFMVAGDITTSVNKGRRAGPMSDLLIQMSLIVESTWRGRIKPTVSKMIMKMLARDKTTKNVFLLLLFNNNDDDEASFKRTELAIYGNFHPCLLCHARSSPQIVSLEKLFSRNEHFSKHFAPKNKQGSLNLHLNRSFNMFNKLHYSIRLVLRCDRFTFCDLRPLNNLFCSLLLSNKQTSDLFHKINLGQWWWLSWQSGRFQFQRFAV